MNLKINDIKSSVCPSIWDSSLFVFFNSNSKEIRSLSWLNAIRYISVENDILNVEAPNELAKSLFLSGFNEIFLKIVQNIDANIKAISVLAPAIKEESKIIAQTPELKNPKKLKSCCFCEKYSLNNFIAETSNEPALEYAKFISSTKRQNENFLILKGTSGLGKTHLLHAIGRESKKWAQNVALLDSDSLFKKIKENHSLDELYMADVLLFDNLQNLYGYEHYQNKLLDILKYLKNKGRTIVVSVNSKCKNIPINEFSDFLKMGIKCELKKPDLRTRVAILHQKAQEKGLPVDSIKVCFNFIAEKFGESVCALEGVINELHARQNLLKSQITPQIVYSIYGEKNTNSGTPTIESIATATAVAYNLPVDSLCGKSRIKTVNIPRQIAIYLCKQTGFSLNEIGIFFKRDVSSVANAVKKVKNKIKSESGSFLEFEFEDILNKANNLM